jgi:hypothetical protein
LAGSLGAPVTVDGGGELIGGGAAYATDAVKASTRAIDLDMKRTPAK